MPTTSSGLMPRALRRLQRLLGHHDRVGPAARLSAARELQSPGPVLQQPVPSDDGFDEAAYLYAHPDVRAAVASGEFASGAAHYESFGRKEGRALRLRVVSNSQELQAEIDWLEELNRTSLTAWLHARAEFTYREDISTLPADPYSPQYRDAQLALYREIAGVTEYDPWRAEPVKLELALFSDPTPFPFRTGQGELIGGHLMSIGHIFQVLWRAKPGCKHRLIEYGCGGGMTTALLAASGYQVTAVDINADAVAIVASIAAGRHLPIRTLVGEFGQVPVEGERFDIVLFYEAFHHCLDFMALLKRLDEVAEADGIIVFAGEPILADFPKPWGLRIDGGALWEIRTKGWLELGFREDFFYDALARSGWQCQKSTFGGVPDVYVARRIAMSG